MFNEQYAQHIYDDFASRDPDEAEMLALFTVYDVITDDMANNSRTLAGSQERILKSMADDYAPLLAASGTDNDLITAAVLSTVSKANELPWKEEDHPRDKAGKFRRAVKAGANEFRSGGKNTLNHNTSFYRNTDDFSRRMQAASNEDSATGRLYGRMEAGGRALSQIGAASHSPGLKVAGGVAQFAGMYGPQAERVVGDSARRNTYRFRGTERPVDKDLRSEALNQEKRISQAEGMDMKDMSDEMRMEAGRRAAVGYYMSKLPKKGLSDLHTKSGRIPPSQGVIISPQGDIVKQSSGYMEDHYLPFNLKDLKQLKGGSYVRTRSTGGPTSEDITAATLAGARSLTVVSRSGVFTMDLADDLKGGRRYNDKVKQMSGQYQNALKAVAGGDVKRRGISAEERADIRASVDEEMAWRSPGAREEEYQKRIADYSAKPSLTDQEMKQIRSDAEEATTASFGTRQGNSRLPDDPQKRFNIIHNEMIEAAMAEKQATNFSLDGEGYEAAMKGLEEQFPYYIQNAQYQPLRDPDTGSKSTERDRNNVGRGQLRAVRGSESARPKLSHQLGRETRTEATSSESTETPEEEKKPGDKKGKLGTFKPFDLNASRAEQTGHLKDAISHVSSLGGGVEEFLKASPVITKLRDGKDLTTDERNEASSALKNLESQIRQSADSEDNKGPLSESMKLAADKMKDSLFKFEGSVKNVGHGATKLERDDTEYSTPINFEGERFQEGQPRQNYRGYFNRMFGESPMFKNQDITDVDDDQLKGMSKMFAQRAGVYQKAADGKLTDEDRQLAFDDAMNRFSAGGAEPADARRRAIGFINEVSQLSDQAVDGSQEAKADLASRAEDAWAMREMLEQGRTLKARYDKSAAAEGSNTGRFTPINSNSVIQGERADESDEPKKIAPPSDKDVLAQFRAAKGANLSPSDQKHLDNAIQEMVSNQNKRKRGYDFIGDAHRHLENVENADVSRHLWHVLDLHDDAQREEDEDY